MSLDLSIVIPYYNRADTIALVLASIEQARSGLDVETIVVDDGSSPPASNVIMRLPHRPQRILRQENRGLLFARLAGLAAAAGEYVLFLDSDDLVAPGKLSMQIAAMRQNDAEVSYTDSAHVRLGSTLDETSLVSNEPPLSVAEDAPDFFIRVQPPPHSPMFRTNWLRAILESPLFPPSDAYNPVAEIWFYHIAAVHRARVIKVDGSESYALIGQHDGIRITKNWERMAVASLAVMEAFMQACPSTHENRRVRSLVAEKAFISWRALPRDFSPAFQERMLALWWAQPDAAPERLGGASFARLAQLIGPVPAAHLLRKLRGHRYASCCTLPDPAQFEIWLREIPRP